ncbi:O-antigen ligase family protein [Aneurinibacillus sp. BA2021]|nr:O-antigen ligase family protein [Aneurinibacillus sp. BA2021]
MNQRSYAHIEWAVLFLYLLPPLGMLWLLGVGLCHLRSGTPWRRMLCDSPLPFFFLTAFLASIGASLYAGSMNQLLIPLLSLGYLGLYMYIKETAAAWHPQRLAFLCTAGGLYIAAIGQLQLLIGYAYGGNWWFGMLTGLVPLGLEEPGRLFGSAYNPNFAAFLLLLSFACLLSYLLQAFLHRQPWYVFLLYTALLAAVTLAIIQTGSRTGTAVMVCLGMLFLWKLNRTLSVWLAAGSVLLCLYTGTLAYVIPRFDSLLQSFETRQTIWKYSMDVWSKQPVFGVTPFGFPAAYAAFDPSGIAHAHNFVLAFFCEYGVIGGTSFLFVLGWYAYKAGQTFSGKSWSIDRLALFFFVLPIIPLTGILDHPLSSPQTALLVVMLIGSWDRALTAGSSVSYIN